MKLIIAIIRPSQVDKVRDALVSNGVGGMTVSEVRGFGRQKGHVALGGGGEVTVRFVPKLRIEVAVPESQQEATDVAAVLRMMDTDKNGVVSKEEFLNYMSQLFDRLDVNKNKQLEPSELRRLPTAVSGPFSTSCQRANPPPRCLQ